MTPAWNVANPTPMPNGAWNMATPTPMPIEALNEDMMMPTKHSCKDVPITKDGAATRMGTSSDTCTKAYWWHMHGSSR